VDNEVEKTNNVNHVDVCTQAVLDSITNDGITIERKIEEQSLHRIEQRVRESFSESVLSGASLVRDVLDSIRTTLDPEQKEWEDAFTILESSPIFVDFDSVEDILTRLKSQKKDLMEGKATQEILRFQKEVSENPKSINHVDFFLSVLSDVITAVIEREDLCKLDRCCRILSCAKLSC
jgi:hypothetical protein